MRLRSVGQVSRRVRPVQRTRRPGLSGRPSGRGPRDHAARRGWRHRSTGYASIADDSEVDLDRPIKCCDDMYSISNYPPAPAMRGGEALPGAPAIGEILTVTNAVAMGPCTTTQRASASLHASRYADRRQSIRARQRTAAAGSPDTRSGQNEPTCRRKSGWHSADAVRAHSDATTGVVEKRRKRREENCRPVDRAHGSG